MRATFGRFLRHPLTRILLYLGVPLLGGLLLPQLAPQIRWSPVSARALLALLALLTMMAGAWWLEDRSPSEVGLGLHGALGETAAGFGVGALLMTAAVGTLWAAGWYQVADVATHWRPVALSLSHMLLVAVLEEVLVRGVLFRILEEWLGSWAALLISAALFGLAHLGNPGSSATAAAAIAVEAGVMLAAAFMLTRRLWLAIGIHWSWNFVQGSIWGLPVSGTRQASLLYGTVHGPVLWTGGSFGPEAGLIGLLVGSAAGILLLWLAARRGEMRQAVRRRR